jgi:8-oxo-dGTP pyrophosphatase MutT (NUDIX family)
MTINRKILKEYVMGSLIKNILLERPNDDDYVPSSKGEYHLSKGDDDRFWGNRGAGILLIAKDTGRLLLTFRSEYVNEPHTWGIPGGAIDSHSESPENAARREAHEELKFSGRIDDLQSAYVFRANGGGFTYYNFIGIIENEFEPRLDWENEDAEWFELDNLPSPLHFGVNALLNNSANQIREIIAGFKNNNEQ